MVSELSFTRGYMLDLLFLGPLLSVTRQFVLEVVVR